MDSEMIVVTFDTPDRADHVMRVIKDLELRNHIRLRAAVALRRELDSRAVIGERNETGSRSESLLDAMAGAIRSALIPAAPPPQDLARSDARAEIETTVVETGFPQGTLQTILRSLAPGNSAIVVLVYQDWFERVMEVLTRFEGRIELTEAAN
jgi:uncharacterized membrane protein